MPAPALSPERKALAVARVLDNGERPFVVAADFGINQSTLHNYLTAERRRRERATRAPAAPVPAADPAAVVTVNDSDDTTAADSQSTDDVAPVDQRTRLEEQDAAAVAYIEWVATERPTQTPERLRELIDQATRVFDSNSGMQRLHAAQARLDLERQLEATERATPDDPEKLEADFVAIAKEWSARRGFSREALLAVGVRKGVLRAARIR